MTQNNVGIYASQISGHLSAPAFQGDYWSLANVTPSGSTSTVSFTGIPGNFKHLQIRYMTKASGTGGVENPWLRFNNDSATNYSAHRLYGDGSSASSDAFTNVAQIRAGFIPDSTTANLMGVAIIDILNYADVSTYKTVRILSGVDQNGSGYVTLSSGNWRSISPITSIDLIENGLNWTSNSQIALYGVK